MAKWNWGTSGEDPFSFSLLVDGRDVAGTRVLMDRGRWTCVIFGLFYKSVSSDDPLEVVSYVNGKVGVDAPFDGTLLDGMRETSRTDVLRGIDVAVNQLGSLRELVLMDGKASGDPVRRQWSMVAAGKIDELRSFLSEYVGRPV